MDGVWQVDGCGADLDPVEAVGAAIAGEGIANTAEAEPDVGIGSRAAAGRGRVCTVKGTVGEAMRVVDGGRGEDEDVAAARRQ